MYLLFAGENYYPQGGYLDFKGEFMTLEAAKRFLDEETSDNAMLSWAHIVKDGKVIAWYDHDYAEGTEWEERPAPWQYDGPSI